MSLLRSDLARNFAIGFALGAIMLGAQADVDLLTTIVPHAAAAVFV